MTRRLPLLLAALLAGCPAEPDTPSVVVHMVPRPATRDPVTLMATLANNNATKPLDFGPVTGKSFPLTFSVTPEGRTGALTVTAVAKGDPANVSTGGSQGVGTASFDPDGVVDLTVMMEPDDFLVNSSTPGAQYSTALEAHTGRQIAVLPDRTFFVTWENNCGQTGRCDILARRFDEGTIPQRNETSGDAGDLIVNLDNNVYTTPAIATGGPDDRVIVAYALIADGFVHDVRVVRLTDKGDHMDGGEIQVSNDPLDERSIDVAVLADGSFVVVWSRPIMDGDPHYQVRVRLYGPDGSPRVNGVTGDDADFPAAESGVSSDDLPTVVATKDGGFVVAWLRQLDGFTEQDVVMRRFDDSATPIEQDATFVTAYFNDSADNPRLCATPSGGFALTWELLTSDDVGKMDQPILAEVYDAAGVPLSFEVQVTSATDASHADPSIAARADGKLGVVWKDCSTSAGDGDGCGIRFQLLAADGTPQGPSRVVDTTFAGEQGLPSIEALGDDGFLITWTDASMTPPDTSDQGIRARVIYP